MRARPRGFWLLAGALLFPGAAGAQGWHFLGAADLFLGQYFFNNSAGSVNGYTDVNLQQARSLSTSDGFFFDEHSVYTGFKQVNELAGGGILFQQSLDNTLGWKWVHRYGDGYSLQPRIGVKSDLFRETSNESWGNGLYDFWRYDAGLTWERKTRIGMSIPWTYQFSYDFYYTHYPHFQTLASQFGAQLAAPSPGAHVLDAYTNQLSYRSEFDLPDFASAWIFYSLSLIEYPDQKLVNSQGNYLDSTRSDADQTLSLGYSKRVLDWQALGRIRPVWGVTGSFSSVISNQNDFDTDPSRLQFVSGYYNYWETHFSPNVQLTFLTPMITARLGYDLGYRAYTGRLAQNTDGSYTGNKLYQFTHSVVLDLAYPLFKWLDLRARGIYSAADSNTHFQQTYTYTYTGWNYFAGVSWKL